MGHKKIECKAGKKGDSIQPVPGQIYKFPRAVHTNQIVQSLLHLHGRGLFQKVTIKGKGKKKGNPVNISAWNGKIVATETPSMNVRGFDFYGISDGAVLGDKYINEKICAPEIGPMTAADATHPRISLITLEPAEDADGAKENQGGQYTIIDGVPSASPEAPDLSDDDQIILAKVTVRAGAAEVLNSDIEDCRKFLPSTDDLQAQIANSASQAELDALAALLDARTISLTNAIAAVAWDAQENAQAITDLQTDITTLQTTVGVVNTGVSSDASTIGGLTVGAAVTNAAAALAATQAFEVAVDTYESGLSPEADDIVLRATSLNSEVNTLASQVALYSSGSTMTSSEIEQLQSSVFALVNQSLWLSRDVGNFGETAAEVTAAKPAIYDAIKDLLASTSALQGDASTLLKGISYTSTTRDTLTELMGDIFLKMSTMISDLSAVKSAVLNLESVVENNSAAIADVEARVSDNENDLVALGGRVDLLEEALEEAGSASGNSGDMRCTTTEYPTFPSNTSGTEMSLDADGNFWAPDFVSDIVHEFQADGTVLNSYTGPAAPNQLNNPIAVAVSPNGTWVAVSEYSDHRVRIFLRSDFSLVATIGTEGAGDGQFKNPQGISFDSGNNLWVIDRGNDRIQKFTVTTWAFESKFGSAGSGASEFNSPRVLTIDQATDYLYVSESVRGGNRLRSFNSAGTLVHNFGIVNFGVNVGGFTDQRAIPNYGTNYNVIVETANGALMAFITDSYYILSVDGGLSWSGLQLNGALNSLVGNYWTSAGFNAELMQSGRITCVGDNVGQGGAADRVVTWNDDPDGSSAGWNAAFMGIDHATYPIQAPGDKNQTGMCIDPDDGKIIYGTAWDDGGAARGLCVTSTDGQNYTMVNSDIAGGAFVIDMAVAAMDSGKLYFIYNGGSEVTYSLSADQGANFDPPATFPTAVPGDLVGNPLAVRTGANSMFVCASSSLVGNRYRGFETTDGGTSWSEVKELQIGGFQGGDSADMKLLSTGDLVVYYEANYNGGDGRPYVSFARQGGIPSSKAGYFNQPAQVVVNGGRVYVLDVYNGRIDVFNEASSAFENMFFVGASHLKDVDPNGARYILSGLDVDPNGSLWVLHRRRLDGVWAMSNCVSIGNLVMAHNQVAQWIEAEHGPGTGLWTF